MALVRPFSKRPEPIPVGRQLPGTPPIAERIETGLEGANALPPFRYPPVDTALPLDPRRAAVQLFQTFEAAWGLTRGLAVWDGMPLQFYDARAAYSFVDAGWNPWQFYPTPNIARGDPQPLAYTIAGR